MKRSMSSGSKRDKLENGGDHADNTFYPCVKIPLVNSLFSTNELIQMS